MAVPLNDVEKLEENSGDYLLKHLAQSGTNYQFPTEISFKTCLVIHYANLVFSLVLTVDVQQNLSSATLK